MLSAVRSAQAWWEIEVISAGGCSGPSSGGHSSATAAVRGDSDCLFHVSHLEPCLRSLVSPTGTLGGDTSELSGFDLFPSTLQEMAISSQLQHFRAVFEHRQDKSEYLHLFHSQECK